VAANAFKKAADKSLSKSKNGIRENNILMPDLIINILPWKRAARLAGFRPCEFAFGQDVSSLSVRDVHRDGADE
jgi:hypothetical protein